MNISVDSRFHKPTKPAAVLGLLVVLVVAFFWLDSRYPVIDEKAAMAGDTLLEDVLSFEAKLPVRDSDPWWQKIAYSTLNWSYTNKEGMAFGVVLAALILTFLRMAPGRPSNNVFVNTLKGTMLGAPLGVCVNCSTPIGKGMYKGGASMEASLATMLSSPNLNVIVIAMTFSLLPQYMAVSKIVIVLLLLLVILPLLVTYAFHPPPRSVSSPAGADLSGQARRQAETWATALIHTGRELWKSFWYIVVRTVPLMLLAGLLGVTVATWVPLEEFADWDVTLPSLVLVALAGTFLPVPIAFDVVLVHALLLAGLQPAFALVLLVTLGSYSIYPFFILWNTMTRRVAVVLFLVVALLGVGAGYFAQGYERYDIARSNALLEARFAERAAADTASTSAIDGQNFAVAPAEKGSPRPSSRTVYQAAGIRVDAVEFGARQAPPATEPSFTRMAGSDIGIEDDRVMFLDLAMPNSQGRGIASGDFDNDGWTDLALASNKGVRLYRNLGNGRYARVPLPQADHLYVKLVALIDIDNDGWLDLYLGPFGADDYFILNDRNGFAAAEMLAVPKNGALFTEAASFFDVDKDGDLDFVKGHWFFLLPRTMPSTRATNYMVWNNGLTFEQTALDEIVGETLTALISDFNADAEPDLIIGNDYREPDIYYLGEGGGRFRQLAAGGPVPISTLATMSVDTGDIDNDLVFDIYLTGKTNDFSTRRDAARRDQEERGARQQSAQTQEQNSRQRDSASGGQQDISELRRLVQSRNREFAEQYCADVTNPSVLENCQAFLDMRMILRKRNMKACKTLPSEPEIDDCMLSLQLLKAQTRRDQQLCDLIPEGFPVHKTMCDAYLAYFRVGEEKPRGYKYLDRGTIDQAMQGNVLLVGSKSGVFTERTKEMGVFDGRWSWNAKFADLDNDEWQDIYVVNGWWLESSVYSSKFFRNHGGERFEAEEEAFGLESKFKQNSYTYVDLNNDGNLDIVSRATHGGVSVYLNNEHKNNRLIFEFRDEVGNSFGIGNKVYIYYGEQQHQVREIKAGSGYLSFDAHYAHFGLGTYDQVNRVEIVWSTGERTVIDRPLEANKKYIVSRDASAEERP